MTTYWHFSATGNHKGWLVDDGGDGYLVANGAAQRQTWSKRLPKSGSLEEIIRSNWHLPSTAAVRVEECKLAPGQYYPRICLPNCPSATHFDFKHEWSSSVRAVRNILSGMEDVFRVVDPQNDHAYGHQIRELLILACTEVESACKAVLRANNYTATPEKRWNVDDFRKTTTPLHLHEYEVALLEHANYPAFQPFEEWASPGAALPWYRAYNAVKHDREKNFKEATLKNMIAAAGAAYVAVYAQFGQFGRRGFSQSETDAFYVKVYPTWGFTECYLPPLLADGATWTPIDYPNF
jgi:hypothetical protein